MEKGLFHVAAKVLLIRENELLLLHDKFGDWDLPGGRILPEEFGGDIADVIARKVRGELGTEVQYELGTLETTFQVERTDARTKKLSRIFGVGYSAKYLGGTISLGKNHDRMQWVALTDFKPDEYFTGGWLRGVQEYLKLQK